MRLLIPNFHVALLHFPLALLAMGVAIEFVCAFRWRDSSARLAARWMILFSVITGWAAVYSGAYAIRTVAGEDFANMTWVETRMYSPRLSDPGLWETLRSHLVINASVVALTSVIVVAWLMAGARFRRTIYWPCLALLLLANAGAVVGAWHGGELVYWHDATHVKESPGPELRKEREVSLSPQSVAPALDTHVVLAGTATGIALIAWGVAARSRRAVVAIDPASGEASLPGTSGPLADSPLIDPQRDRIFAAFQPATVEVVAPPPSATLGWLAAFAFVAASAFGMWSLAESYESWSPRTLWSAIITRNNEPIVISRRLAHLIGGTLVIVLSIAVGIAGARSRGSRSTPMIVGFVLFVALVAEAWLGVQLLLDTNSGPVTRFNI